MPTYETLLHAAERTGVPREILVTAAKRRRISTHKVGPGTYLVTPDGVDAWIEKSFIPEKEFKPRGRPKGWKQANPSGVSSPVETTPTVDVAPVPLSTPLTPVPIQKVAPNAASVQSQQEEVE